MGERIAGVESAAEWGRRQAAAAPRWSERQLHAIAAVLGIRLSRRPVQDVGHRSHVQDDQPECGQKENGSDG